MTGRRRDQRTSRSITTTYKGCRFRSRLEARWAVFFDTLGIAWEYEPEGYVIDGTPDLPDFKLILLERAIICEVKNVEADDHEGQHVDLCRGLARALGTSVLLLTGVPSYRMYNQFTPTLDEESFTAAFFTDREPLVRTADSYWFQQVVVIERTGALEFPHDDHSARRSFGQGVVDAVHVARAARFEHGESPLTSG